MNLLRLDSGNYRCKKRRADAGVCQSFSGLLLLVVDDCKLIAKATATVLLGLGYDVHLAYDGKQAVKACLERAYSCVFMDYVMPEMDGLQATKIIRSMERRTGAHTPIIGHSASVEGKILVAAGMDDFISKPASAAALDEKIAMWCGPLSA